MGSSLSLQEAQNMISTSPSLLTVPLEERRFCSEDQRSSSENASRYITSITRDESCITTEKALQFLCLHGWRTSGDILRMQTAALRSYLQINCVFPNAAIAADGPPDDGVTTFYPDMNYFEWYLKGEQREESIDQSLCYLLEFVERQGPFDGILGFSQGSSMATMLADRLLSNGSLQPSVLRYILLIGGVEPPSSHAPRIPLDIKSLHVMGLQDDVLPRSKALKDMFANDFATVIEHGEGHNIPSVRTDTYHVIKKWLWEDEGYDYKVHSGRSS